MKFKSLLLRFISILTLFLILMPSFAFSEQQYKVFFKKAQSLDKDKFFEDAESYWQKTIDANPPSNIILYAKLKLSSIYLRLGLLDKAIRISRALTESNPSHFDTWFHLAIAFAASREYPQAVEAFKKATTLKPEEGLNRVGLAFAYFGDQKPDFATKEFMKAMKIFKANKNISWYQDCRLAINQIKGFARFPKNFADLWLKKNLTRVQETYMNTVLDLDSILN
jgi:tetratricopeptide (TPR) repeat protein